MLYTYHYYTTTTNTTTTPSAARLHRQGDHSGDEFPSRALRPAAPRRWALFLLFLYLSLIGGSTKYR